MATEFATRVTHRRRGRAVARLIGLVLLVLSTPVGAQRRVPYEHDNQAVDKEAFMVRLTDNLPPASNGNDGDTSTIVTTTTRTVDGYWEVDLGRDYAVYHVQVDAASGFGDRMTHATVRLFDAQHESVFSQALDELSPPTFYVDCGGPRRVRYVRVGFEYKERSSADGGIEWYLGLKEVMVIGRPIEEVGLLAFEVATGEIQAGESVTLSWLAEDTDEITLYPDGIALENITDANGLGSLELWPEASVEYTLVADGAFGRDIKARTVSVDDRTLPVRINELVASNRLSLEDGYGDSPDWIELYNPGPTAVDLTGWGLSDSIGSPMKWVFPEVTIGAHDYLIVFASDRDEPVDPNGYLHTNYRLDADGESVVLTGPDGTTTVDSIAPYPALCEDLAYGRDMQGGVTFREPTPAAINLTTSYEGWLAPAVFSHERGFCESPFELSLSHEDPEAQIRVSVDGGDPDFLYDGPIQVTGTTVVRATVVRPGYKSPRLQTHTFLYPADMPGSSVMNAAIAQDPRYARRLYDGLWSLPTVAIAVAALPDDYRKREASVELFWPDGAPAVQANCGMVRYGGAWTTFAKKNYRLKFKREYGTPKFKAPLFDGFDRSIPAVETFDELELGGGSHDMNSRGFYMASSFVEDTMLDMGSLNPHGRFVHLYINGTYWGQYYLRERLVEHFMADYLGGEPEDYLNVRGNDNVGGSFIPGTPDPINRHSWDRVRALAGSYQDVKDYLDVSGLIDFMLLWFYGNCESEYRASGPVEAGSGFKFWIADSDGFLRTSALGLDRTSNAGPGGLFGVLVSEADPDFMTLLADRTYRHLANDGALTPNRNATRLIDRMLEIQDSLIAECARWRYRTPDNWNDAADEILDELFPVRTDQLLALLRNRGLYPSFDPPRFSQRGGHIPSGFELVLSADLGTIYYTLDGSDPRLPGGDVSPTALTLDISGSGELLIAAGSSWRYWDRGAEPGSLWTDAGFDDETWASGPAPLGYGDGDEATVIGYGPDSAEKYIASYFRQSFNVDDPAGIDALTVQLMRDDGAVVYLNGVELLRDNMPAGDITAATTASTSVGGTDESTVFTFNLSSDALVSGRNVLAVEVHQRGPTSSDVSFALALQARRLFELPPIVLETDTVIKTRILVGDQWSALNEAHFTINE